MKNEMTDQQINIAIAESLGYMDIYRCGSSGKRTEQGLLHGKLLCGTLDQPSPNYGREYVFIKRYTHCLNAMHEAEKVLTAEQRRSYVSYIFNLPASECESNTFATAAQRAKAFLRTIGKWIE